MFSNEDFIGRHVEDYNNHDLDALVAAFDKDVKIYNLIKQTLLMEGRENIREFYTQHFAHPILYSDVTERIVLGNKIIDKQTFTSEADNLLINAVTIYNIENNLIKEVWLIFE
ncbi:hypothetical protein M2475_001863 [Breznakia sp. PF5-3]|uniref:nuclear transport factor 2 family protein n=1 Tax=unclassified Breznakia TaxID=2623764 RepID=UPI002406811D|nr:MULTISPECIES: nuclear transport factor 2 family protein [unclassified Breznakia]MDF9825408.1 hypothetical protein [Breznakia sp. PM6-1]MDF9836286.1 hypothetical protein [Breznakia sp. PF5-3]